MVDFTENCWKFLILCCDNAQNKFNDQKNWLTNPKRDTKQIFYKNVIWSKTSNKLYAKKNYKRKQKKNSKN